MPEHRVLRSAGALWALAMLLAGRAAAQSSSDPQLTFSITAGITSSGGELWTLPKQPLYVIGTSNPPEFDTLKVARYLRPGIAATLSATYMRSPHLGFTGEVGYFDIESEQRCDSTATYQPDPAAENKNAQACSNAQGAHVPTSVFGIQFGAAWRFTTETHVQPYIRASAGVGFLSNSFVLTSANVLAPTTCAATNSICTVVMVDGESTPELGFLATLAAGASLTISPGYRFRFEARDLIVELPAPSRPANPSTALAPVGTVLRHIPVFTVGLDVVLERRRGRRY